MIWRPFSILFIVVYLTAADQSDEEGGVHETQSAQCTITAGDVQASAQATISKRLEGVCGSVQLARSFELLEARLMQELGDIRRMLSSLNGHHNPIVHNSGDPFYNQRHVAPLSVGNYMQLVPQQRKQPSTQPTPIATDTTITPSVETPSANLTTAFSPTTPTPPSTTTPSNRSTLSTSTERQIHFQPVQTKSLHHHRTPSKHRPRTRPRELEVAHFNNTLLSGDEIRIFSYYWRIEHFQRQLAAGVLEIDSPTFAIAGLRLRVHATLNHLNRDYLHLQVQSVPLLSASTTTTGDDRDDNDDDDEQSESNVVLETGSMFRDIQTREHFRHRIAILDQETPTKDLVSQELANTQGGFQVPNSAIVAGPYAKDSAILIKVTIYL